MLAYYPKKFVRYLRATRAVSALEYAILIGVIAVAMSVALMAFSDSMSKALKEIGDKVKDVNVDSGVGT